MTQQLDGEPELSRLNSGRILALVRKYFLNCHAAGTTPYGKLHGEA